MTDLYGLEDSGIKSALNHTLYDTTFPFPSVCLVSNHVLYSGVACRKIHVQFGKKADIFRSFLFNMKFFDINEKATGTINGWY